MLRIKGGPRSTLLYWKVEIYSGTIDSLPNEWRLSNNGGTLGDSESREGGECFKDSINMLDKDNGLVKAEAKKFYDSLIKQVSQGCI